MITVTGATGHIGNVLVRELLAMGEEVRTVIPPLEDTVSLEGLRVEKAENEKARRQLGYSPRPIAESIEDSIKWFKKAELT